MLLFLRRNQVLLCSFLSILFSFYLLLAASRGHARSDPVGPLLLELLRPFQIAARATVMKSREIQQGFAGLWGLLSDNDRLRQQIQQLETERHRLLEAEATNLKLRELLDLKAELPKGSISAAVIANSASTWFQSLTLDKGSRDGMSKGMAVVSPMGVVGQVVDVTPRGAKVLLVTDPHSAVDVFAQRSRSRGIVAGFLNNGAIMKYVKRSEDIQVDDRLITSGLDGIFPKGLLVGTVTAVSKKGRGLFQSVEVSLAVDPSRMEEVLVLFSEETRTKK